MRIFSRFWWALVATIKIVYKYIYPIWKDIADIVKALKSSLLSNDDKRKEAFKMVTDIIKEKPGISLATIPDSVINSSIELIYQIVKHKLI